MSTKMLIIDEVSFLDEDNIRKLDKHMRKLKEKDVMFGGVHIAFVGYFLRCCLLEVYLCSKNNTIQFIAINSAVYLNVSHQFSEDPMYGEIMKQFRVGIFSLVIIVKNAK